MSRAARPVWVVNLQPPVPTYHTWASDEVAADGSYRTRCGVLMWDRHSRKMNGLYIRTAHAEKIGRPCARCFEVAA